MKGKEGLLHVSEHSNERIEDMRNEMSEGDTVKVKLIAIDEKTGKYRLSSRIDEDSHSRRPSRFNSSDKFRKPRRQVDKFNSRHNRDRDNRDRDSRDSRDRGSRRRSDF